MTQKHTPGPWKIQPNNRREDNRKYITIIRDIGSMPRICEIDENYEEEPELDVANARLIAAAPLLLGALEEARDFIRGFEDDEMQEGMEALMNLINKAINQAIGN